MSSALQYLHSKGIIVVDCTPHNFIVTKSMVLKLSHLALSTKVISFFSSQARYAAPEHIPAGGRDTEPTKASDVFTLGTSLLRLMTGNQPFAFLKANGLETVMQQRIKYHIHNPIFSDFQCYSDVLKTIISDCCEVDPAKRPSIDDVVARMEADQKILRGRFTNLDKGRQWSWKNCRKKNIKMPATLVHFKHD